MTSLPNPLRLARAALLALVPLCAGCRGAALECFTCLDTFVVYVKGEGDWLGKGYELEVEADDEVYTCPTGTAERIGHGAVKCGKGDAAPLIWVRGSEDEPIVRISFWEATPGDVRVSLLDGNEVLARDRYEPVYEDIPAGNTCPVCTGAESETLRVEDASPP